MASLQARLEALELTSALDLSNMALQTLPPMQSVRLDEIVQLGQTLPRVPVSSHRHLEQQADRDPK